LAVQYDALAFCSDDTSMRQHAGLVVGGLCKAKALSMLVVDALRCTAQVQQEEESGSYFVVVEWTPVLVVLSGHIVGHFSGICW
jgi:hypothetical protein